MKTIKILTTISLCLIMLGTTSCLVLVPHEKGGRKGWHKNSNNPHHIKTTNPGHTKGRGKN